MTTHVFDFADAKLSPCGLYRYRLDRGWPGGDGRIVWMLCNPSTATATVPDPTLRRCVSYAIRWGYNALTIVNMCAWRSTQPEKMIAQHLAGVDIVGPDNDHEIRLALTGAQALVLGWGSLPKLKPIVARGTALVLEAAAFAHVTPMCLGQNQDGSPRHPLYLANDTPLVPFLQAA